MPAALAGNTVGFHLLHLGLFAAVPALVCADCRIARWPFSTAALPEAAALAAVNYGYFLIRSGDTKLAGRRWTCTATLVSAHAAREGRRWSAVCLVLSLTLTNYAHRGFFVVAAALAVDAIVALDRRSAWRALVASATAWIAGLPYVGVLAVSVVFPLQQRAVASDLPFDWKGFATSVFYNVEILARPGRWFNDYTGLANLCLPVTAFVALRHRDRSTFHAWALLQ